MENSDGALAINFFSVTDGKHENAMGGIINGVDDSIISHPQAIVAAVLQFFASKRSRLAFQKKNFYFEARAQLGGDIGEFLFGFGVDKNAISHLAGSCAKKSLKGLKGPERREWAMAMSIKSSLSSLVSNISRMTSPRVFLGRDFQAVIKTRAVACVVVMDLV